MCKYYALFAVFALLISQQSVAADAATTTSSTTVTSKSSSADDVSFKPCKAIADACSSAGFTRKGAAGKGFWRDCMKPLLLGKTVDGVSVDSKDVVACKQFKTQKMQKELQQLQSK